MLDAVPERDNSLQSELERQQQNEQLRVQFAEIANEVGAYIVAKSSALAELSMQGQETMEEQLQAVKDFQAETLAYQPNLDKAETANQVRICKSFLVFFSFFLSSFPTGSGGCSGV